MYVRMFCYYRCFRHTFNIKTLLFQQLVTKTQIKNENQVCRVLVLIWVQVIQAIWKGALELKIGIRMIEKIVDRVRIKMNFVFNIIRNPKLNFKVEIAGDLFIFLTFLLLYPYSTIFCYLFLFSSLFSNSYLLIIIILAIFDIFDILFWIYTLISFIFIVMAFSFNPTSNSNIQSSSLSLLA